MKKQTKRGISTALAVLLLLMLTPMMGMTVYAAELVPVLPAVNENGARYWSFDKDFGGAIPIFQGNGFGTNTSDTNIGDLTPEKDLVTGVEGKAVKLDGRNGLYLGTGLISSNTFTIAFWVKPTAPLAQGFSPIFYGARGGNSGDRWISIHANTGRITAGGFGMDFRYDNNRPYNFADTALTEEVWQHVVVSNNNGTVTLYLNGLPLSKVASNQAIAVLNATAKFYLGVTHTATDIPFACELDELYVYNNKALTAAEVAMLLDPDIKLPTEPAAAPVVPAKTPDGAYYWSFNSDLGGAANVALGAGMVGVNTEVAGKMAIDPNGKKGGAASFDCFSGLYLGDNLITSDKYTVAFWASPKSAADMASLFFGGNQNEYLNFTTKISGQSNSGVRTRKGGTNNDFTMPMLPGGWTHCTLTVDGANAEFWVNGFRVGTKTNFTSDLFGGVADAKYFLGVNYTADAYIGMIDELYVYDGKVLPRGEIMELADVYAADRGQYITPGANAKYVDPPAPTFSNVSVHDPSIMKIDNQFYIVGTHLASGKSTDLMNWTRITGDGANPSNRFYPQTGPDSITPIADQIAKAGSGIWALDTIKLKDGRYYQYYSLSASTGAVQSGIGVAVSDNIEGPYETIDLFLRSGLSNDNKAMYGDAAYDPAGVHPNCIDPAPFFDKNGKFWLVYGSWFGGIHMMEMNPDTGLPVPYAESAFNRQNDGFGKKIIAGRYNGTEGPYIIYSPESDYYYLFLSFDGLDWNGGYNIRVFRSRNADGPYEDGRFTNLTTLEGTPGAFTGRFVDTDGTFFSHADRGVKIMGGYQFIGTDSEDTLIGNQYLSPGHNSAYYDAEMGRYFLVNHVRFDSSNGHQVRVAELFINADGWLVAAPFRYDGGAVREFSKSDVVGSYKVLYHGRDINTTARRSTLAYNLTFGGSVVNVTGAPAGSWSLSGKNTAVITIDGVTYNGVFLREYDENQAEWVQTFTALSSDGLAIWGVGVTGAAAAPAIGAVSVSTPTIVATLAANLAVAVEGGFGKTLTAYLKVGDELLYATALTNGKGTMKITAAPAAGSYELVVAGDGLEGSCAVEVVPYNTNIWQAAVRIVDGKLLVVFNADLILKSEAACVTVGGVKYDAKVLDDGKTVEVLGLDASALAGGTPFSVAGVKYPVLFPSYSFTFTVTVP